jgi:hypothetical protein
MPKARSLSLSLSLARARARTRGQRSRYYAVRRRDLTWAASESLYGGSDNFLASIEGINSEMERSKSAGRVIELFSIGRRGGGGEKGSSASEAERSVK